MPIRLVGLDADDTLWHNETFFRTMHERFITLLGDYAGPEELESALAATDRRNLGLYGYGAKGFTLSMLETALTVSEGRVSAAVMREILEAGRELMRHPVELLPGVEEALAALAQRARLVLITKGDLVHQEAKLAASGIGSFFEGVEIVSDKTAETYRRAFARHGSQPETSLMAGNSVRSDVLPALEAGSWAALIPYPLVWDHEAAGVPASHPRFRELSSLAELPGWIERIG